MAEGATSPLHAKEMKSFPVFRALKWHVPKLCRTISVGRVGVVTSGQRGFTQSILYQSSELGSDHIMVLNGMDGFFFLFRDKS